MTPRIRSVDARTVRIPMRDPLATSLHTYAALEIVVVRMVADDGTTGFGEARESLQITGETTAGIVAAVNGLLGPAVTGTDPFDMAGLHHRMDAATTGNTAAKSAVDIAAHDIAGHLSGLPVSRLLGGAPRAPVASSKAVSVGTVDAVVAQARRFVADGFQTLKIKTGVDAEAELTAIRAVREAVGPEINLKLDANQGWSLPEATWFLERAVPCDILMVEQPLPAGDLAGAAALRRRVPIPVMLDESVHSPRDALDAIAANACDYVNIKLLKTGGLHPARAVNAICAATGVACQIGTLDSSIGSAAALHLVHACPNIRFAEINGPTRLEWDVARGFRIEHGWVAVGEGSGLGVTVDTALLDETAHD